MLRIRASVFSQAECWTPVKLAHQCSVAIPNIKAKTYKDLKWWKATALMRGRISMLLDARPWASRFPSTGVRIEADCVDYMYYVWLKGTFKNGSRGADLKTPQLYTDLAHNVLWAESSSTPEGFTSRSRIFSYSLCKVLTPSELT